MNGSFFILYPLLWTFICSDAVGRPITIPSAVSALVQRADPQANVEYCGSVSTNRVDYYLFLLTRKELAGIVLVQYPTGKAPSVADADTSLFPFSGFPQHSFAQPLQEGIEELLTRRNLEKNRPARQGISHRVPEISAVGRDIDHVVYPISGFRTTGTFVWRLLTSISEPVRPVNKSGKLRYFEGGGTPRKEAM